MTMRSGERGSATPERALYDFTDRLYRARSLADVYEAGLDSIIGALGCDRASVLLFDDEGVMRFVAWRGLSDSYRTAVEGHSPWQPGTRNPEPIGVADIPAADLEDSLKAIAAAEGVAAFGFIPMLVDDELIGKFMVYYNAPHDFGADELELAVAIGRQLAFGVQRERAEAERSVAERRFRQVTDVLPQFIWVNRPDGSIEYVNDRWVDYSGLDLAATADQAQLANAIHPDDRDEMFRRWAESVADGRAFEIEARLRRRDGAFRWFLVHTVPVHDDGGRVVNWFGSSTDIHAQKLEEADARVLAELGELIRLATDSDDLLYEVSRVVGDHLDVRRAFFVEIDEPNDRGVVRRDYCRGAESVAGEYRVSEYSDMTRAEIATGRTVVNRDSRTDARTAADFDATYAPRGERAYVAVPLMRDARWIGAFWVSTDEPRGWTAREIHLLETVAERTWNAVEKLRLDAALRESDRRKDEFLATLAHELRNPLGPIRNALSLIEIKLSRGEGVEPVLDVIDRQTDRLRRLVDDLMDVSRITRGYVALRREPVDLAELVGRAVEGVADELSAKQIDLRTILPPGAATVLGDWVRLEQIVGNLLTNAIKYTDAGGLIELSVDADADWAEVRVQDSGVGIDPAFLPHIFDLFEQADHSLHRSQGGLGIGLTVTKTLVELHGGTIEARSNGLGTGSEFIVRFPVVTADAAAALPGDSGTRDTSGDASNRRRVLVVDDNVDHTTVIAELIAELGHAVQVGRDGEDALRLAREFQPDVVLLDIGLPGLSGYEVAELLRRDASTRRAVLVALTGYGQPADRERSALAGFDAHVVKPIELADLERILAQRSTPSSSPLGMAASR